MGRPNGALERSPKKSTSKNEKDFISDIMRFLDNVLQDFIDNAPDTMKSAAYAAMRERSVGLGVMGLHSFFQANNVHVHFEDQLPNLGL